MKELRGKARECYLRGWDCTPILTDSSTRNEVAVADGALREAMTSILDGYVRKKQWCSRSKQWYSRSKPWWNEDLRVLRKDLGRARRNWRVAGISRVQAAQREFLHAIQRAKRNCWNRFMQEADGNKVWMAARYTTSRRDKAGQALRCEDVTIAEGHWEQQQALLLVHFPQGPPGNNEPASGGQAFKRLNAALVGTFLGAAENTSTPEEDQISADIVQVFWQWDKQRITMLVRTCIRLGFHPGI